MMRVLKWVLLTAALLLAAGQAANAQKLTAQKLTKEFLASAIWEGRYNIEARQSYTAPTTITFKVSPSGKLSAVVESKFFRTLRKLPATGRITEDGLLVLDFSTAAAQRIMRLKRDGDRLVGEASTLIRGFPGKGRASFKKR